MMCMMLVGIFFAATANAGMENIYCHNVATGWEGAKDLCVGRNQGLPKPKTDEDIQLIMTTCGPDKNRWTQGAKNMLYPQGDFQYGDGSVIPQNLWAPGTPDNWGGDEDHVNIDKFTFKLNDVRIEAHYPSHYPIYAVCVDEVPNYYCHDSETTWEEAKAICEGRNQVLIQPRSRAEIDAVHNKCGVQNFWTAARQYPAKPGRPFLYLDNTNIPNELWIPGEPNDVNNNEDCVNILMQYGLNDRPCSFPTYPVCQDKYY